MNITPEYLAALQSYGYTRTEAEFLYLVATHSGYFTQRQFLRFARVEQGGAVSRFTEKLLRFRHGRTTRYGYNTLIYNLYSRLIYGCINKDNLRNRRRLSNDLIRTRLLILDFVLGHLEHQYLETESDKVDYFHRTLCVPLPMLPGRIYKGIKSNSNTKRHFVDRFPIFIPCGSESLFLPLAPTFVYCDSADPGLFRYIGHLRAYEHLLNQLTSFNFVYAAASDTKFMRAGKFFARRFTTQDNPDTELLIRYFKIRQLWEDHKTSALTRPDRQLLRDGDRRFHSQVFEDAYRQWAAAKLSQTDLNDVLRRAKAQESRLFSTCVLSNDYDIFERLSKDYSADQAGAISRNRSSMSHHALQQLVPRGLQSKGLSIVSRKLGRALSRELRQKLCDSTGRIPIPLLRPPDPKIPTRKFHVRIEEPLAITLARYAEFLGTTGIDHVVNQALEFVFRKNTDFKDWLAQHSEGVRKEITIEPHQNDGCGAGISNTGGEGGGD